MWSFARQHDPAPLPWTERALISLEIGSPQLKQLPLPTQSINYEASPLTILITPRWLFGTLLFLVFITWDYVYASAKVRRIPSSPLFPQPLSSAYFQLVLGYCVALLAATV